jgi:cyclopropane-fatty-acyl-phospholipid synthase
MSGYEASVKQLFSVADIEINGNRPADIIVHDSRFYKRFLRDGRLGMGESYMAGWWDCEDLVGMFYKFFSSRQFLLAQIKNTKIIISTLKSKFIPEGSLTRSSEIAEKHYNLGNDLYESFLDSHLQYTCGYWQDGATNLEEAQQAKLDLICRKLKIEPGMRLLDVGCGWGGLARFAAEKYGASVVGITVSDEQKRYAEECCKGLDVEIRLQDYRYLDEQFDRITTVGMIEHVGPKYHKVFFEKMRDSLKDDGLYLLHTIGFYTSKFYNPWLTKYIFPGCWPPSLQHIASATEEVLVCEDLHNFGVDYDPTLLAWNEKFVQNWDKIKDNYDERFFRMWQYYLLSCAAGFRARFTHLYHFVFSKHGVPGGYSWR